MLADSHAYVIASYSTAGGLLPFNLERMSFGQEVFVPAGANLISVAPGTHQLWEATTAPGCSGTCHGPFSINVIDPKTGDTLGAIPLNYQVFDFTFGKGGQYAFASLSNGDLLKIDVATRTIMQTLSQQGGGLLPSTDGTQLFIDQGLQLTVMNPETMTTVQTLQIGHDFSMAIYGNTLLICTGSALLYFHAATLKQTYSVSVTPNAWIVGISPDGTRIYLGTTCYCNDTSALQVLDFSTGAVVTSLTQPGDGFQVVVAPNGQLLLLGGQVQILDPDTLATVGSFTPPAAPGLVIFIDYSTMLIVYDNAGAMMVVDQATAQLTDTFAVGASLLSNGAASPHGSTIFAGGSGNLMAVSTATDQVGDYLPVSRFYVNALIGEELWGSPGYWPVLVYNFDTQTASDLPVLGRGNCPYCQNGYASPNGKSYWVPYSDTSGIFNPVFGVAIYSTAAHNIAGKITFSQTEYSPVAFSPDSSTAYIGVNDTILAYDTTTLQQTGVFAVPATVRGLQVSTQGAVLFAISGTYVFLIDSTTGALKATYVLPDSACSSLGIVSALSPDGAALFVADPNHNSLHIVGTATGQVTQVALPYTPTGLVVVP
jgi:hypothetical protein